MFFEGSSQPHRNCASQLRACCSALPTLLRTRRGRGGLRQLMPSKASGPYLLVASVLVVGLVGQLGRRLADVQLAGDHVGDEAGADSWRRSANIQLLEMKLDLPDCGRDGGQGAELDASQVNGLVELSLDAWTDNLLLRGVGTMMRFRSSRHRSSSASALPSSRMLAGARRSMRRSCGIAWRAQVCEPSRWRQSIRRLRALVAMMLILIDVLTGVVVRIPMRRL